MQNDPVYEEKIALKEKLSYGGLQFASCIYFAFSIYYLMGFLTDYALIPAAVTSVLLLTLRLLSAAADQAVGVMINRVNFKGGKYRPWFRMFAVPYAVCIGAIGFIPGVGMAGRVAFAAAALALCEIFRSILGISAVSMLPYIARTDAGRANFISFSNACAIMAFFLIGTFMMPLSGFLGGGDMRRGIAATLAIFAIIAAPLFFSAYFILKEGNMAPDTHKPPLKETYAAILQNRRLLSFLFGYGIYCMADSFRGQLTYFFVTYNLGRPELLPVVIMAGLLSPIAMQPFIPKMLSFAKKETLMAIGILGASVLGFFIFPFCGNPAALIAYAVIYGVFTAIYGNLSFALLASFADEFKNRHNMQISDLLFASSSLFYKVGMAAAGGIAPLVMWLTGYVAQAARQSTSALAGFKAMYILCNAAALAVTGIIMILIRRNPARGGTQT